MPDDGRMAMTMSIGVEFVLKDSFSGPASKITSAFTSLRQSVGGLPGVTGQFNGFSNSIQQGVGQMLKGKGGGGGGSGGGGLSAVHDVVGKLATSFIALKGVAAGMDMFAVPLASARAFGMEMGQIRTIANESVISTDAVRDATFGLADAYGTDATSAAHALYETISAGITDATKATDLMRTANEFAIGGNTDLASGVDILTSAVNTYSAQGLTARDASDALFVAIAAGKTTAGELSQKLGEVAPTAQAAGISFQELTGSIAALTLQGIKTPQAVTGLNAMIANIAKPSKDAATEAKRLGIEWSLTALKGMGLQKFLGQLANNAKVGIESFPKLFGSIDGIKAAFALTAEGGLKLNEVMKQMGTASGATKAAFDIMAETSDFQMKRFEALKKNSLTLIGEALEPLAAKALKVGADILSAFNDLPEGVRGAIVRGVAFVAMVGTALMGILAFASGVSAVVGQLVALGEGLGVAAAAGAPLLLLFGGAALGAAGLKVGIEQNLGGLGEYLTDKFNKVKLALSALAELFTSGEVTGDAAVALMDPANASVLGFVKNVYTAGARIMNFLDGIGTGFTATMHQIEPLFSNFRSSIEGLDAAMGGLSQAMSPEDSKTAFDEAGKSGEGFGATLGKIAGIALRVMTGMVDLSTGAIEKWDAMKSALSPIGDALSSIGTTISDIANEFGTASNGGMSLAKVGGFIVQGFANVLTAVGYVIGAMGSMFRGIINVVMGVVNILDGFFHGRWGQMWKGVGQVVYGVVTAILGFVTGMVSGVLSGVDSLARAFGIDLGLAKFVDKFGKDLDKEFKMSLGLEARPVSADPVEDNQLFATNDALQQVATDEGQLFGTNDSVNATEETPAGAAAAGDYASNDALVAAMDGVGNKIDASNKKPVQLRSEVNLIADGVTLATVVADSDASTDDLSYK